MNIDQVVADFGLADGVLPKASMQWALDNWQVAGPRFVELLERCADGLDRAEETNNALFFVIHLLGEKREAKAFPALCRLLKDAEASEAVLGDAIGENLCDILIGLYDGDRSALQEVIESTTADEFARAAALEAMAYLAGAGAFTDGEMRAYLLHLLAEMRPQADCFIWSAWALSAANLGYQDYAGKVDELIRRDFIPYRAMDMDDFNRQLRRTLDDPARMAGFEFDRIGPFEDSIGTLSSWYGFSEQARIDEAKRAARAEANTLWPIANEPYVDALRHVGRNDPCPCGSGKKYKKCCLAA